MSIPDETLARWAAWPRPGTPPPWEAETKYGPYIWAQMRDDPHEAYVVDVLEVLKDEDVELMGLAPEMREAIDALVAEVRRLRAWMDSEGRDCPSSTTIDAALRGDA